MESYVWDVCVKNMTEITILYMIADWKGINVGNLAFKNKAMILTIFKPLQR